MQTCLSIMTVMANGCGPVVSLRTERRHGSPPHEQQPRTLHPRTDASLVSPSDSILILLPLCF
jgi:hypothetical protein